MTSSIQSAEAMREEALRLVKLHSLGWDHERSKRLIARIRAIPLPTEAAEPGEGREAMVGEERRAFAREQAAIALGEPGEANGDEVKQIEAKAIEIVEQIRDNYLKFKEMVDLVSDPLFDAANRESALRADLARMKSALEKAKEGLKSFVHLATPSPDDEGRDGLEGLPDSHQFELVWSHETEDESDLPDEQFQDPTITAGQIRRARLALTAIDAALQEPTNANR